MSQLSLPLALPTEPAKPARPAFRDLSVWSNPEVADSTPDASPLELPIEVVEGDIPYACTHPGCSRVTASGLFGPPTYVQQDHVGFLEKHDTRWYCRRHGDALWRWYFDPARLDAVAARRTRLERWKRGEMPWQKKKGGLR